MNHPHLVRRGSAALCLSALVLSGTALVPAPAQAAVAEGRLSSSGSYRDSNSGCTGSGGSQTFDTPTWTDNGKTVRDSYAVAGKITGPTPTDVTNASVKAATAVVATPIRTGPATITVTSSLEASAIPVLPATTACNGLANADSNLDGSFALARPMWATITLVATGSGAHGDMGADVRLDTAESETRLVRTGRGTATITAFLPAGAVDLDYEAWLSAQGSEPGHRVSSLDVRLVIALQPLGDASPVTGTGRSYVAPGVRSCPAGTVTVGIAKKAAKRAQRIQLSVNGRPAASLRGQQLRKRSFVLRAPAASSATVAARITLRDGKRLTVSRSYLPCS